MRLSRLPHTRLASLRAPGSRRQKGATLIIGLIMIVLITLIVVNAYTLSSSNLKSVGNMQMREEGIAAANQAIEQVISSPFTSAPTAQSINVDIDKNGTTDYVVEVDAPECIRSATAAGAVRSQIGLPTGMTLGNFYNTDWDIKATVTDAASGASVVIRQGTRVRISETSKAAVCP